MKNTGHLPRARTPIAGEGFHVPHPSQPSRTPPPFLMFAARISHTHERWHYGNYWFRSNSFDCAVVCYTEALRLMEVVAEREDAHTGRPHPSKPSKSLATTTSLTSTKQVPHTPYHPHTYRFQPTTRVKQPLTPGTTAPTAQLHSNLAACYIALETYVLAAHHAGIATDVDHPTIWKAHWRQGLALIMMAPGTVRLKTAERALEAALACGADVVPAEMRGKIARALALTQTNLRAIHDSDGSTAECKPYVPEVSLPL